VLDGDTGLLAKKGAESPQFLDHLYCGQTAGCIKTPLGVEVGLSPGDIALDRDPAPYPKRGRAPPSFRSTSIVAKRLHGSRYATWYGGRPRPIRNIVLDLDPASPRKRAHPPPPNFGPCLLWPNDWMDEDGAWYGSRHRPRPHCTRRGPSSRERGTAAPSFRPMSVVATVAHLSYC